MPAEFNMPAEFISQCLKAGDAKGSILLLLLLVMMMMMMVVVVVVMMMMMMRLIRQMRMIIN